MILIMALTLLNDFKRQAASSQLFSNINHLVPKTGITGFQLAQSFSTLMEDENGVVHGTILSITDRDYSRYFTKETGNNTYVPPVGSCIGGFSGRSSKLMPSGLNQIVLFKVDSCLMNFSGGQVEVPTSMVTFLKTYVTHSDVEPVFTKKWEL